MRKVITIILLSLLVIASVSASAIHSLNFAYSVHEGSHIGIDYSGSSTSPVHVYGGIYGLFALGNARPGVTAGIYLGPGFSIPLNENRSLLLQLADGLLAAALSKTGGIAIDDMTAVAVRLILQ